MKWSWKHRRRRCRDGERQHRIQAQRRQAHYRSWRQNAADGQHRQHRLLVLLMICLTSPQCLSAYKVILFLNFLRK